MSMQMDCSDIVDVFKTHLKVENSVKTIAHTFLNERYASKVDFAPYFQRKYVWDSEKASYFIESIILGTEIPPIVLFDNHTKNEVIDGRQRYETIKRFLENKLMLDKKGLKALTTLEGKYYSQLPEETKIAFKNTKIRVLQFSVVNEPSLTPEQEDKIKKEIFKRYNSGITALKKQDIERAAYINDRLVAALKTLLESDDILLNKCNLLLMPKRKQNMNRRDKINNILSRVRTLLAMQYIPIKSYAFASSKLDVVKNYLILEVEKNSVESIIELFENVIEKIFDIRTQLVELNNTMADNVLLYETLFWGLSLTYIENQEIFEKFDNDKLVDILVNCSKHDYLWNELDEEKRDIEQVFLSTGSHYARSVINRYTLISNYFKENYSLDFSLNLDNKENFKQIMSKEVSLTQVEKFKLSKTDPISASVYDILQEVKSQKFLIRPDYQRSEVSDTKKASYLLESIMLGIKIPPIFIYRRDDYVSEVIDGQQRLLSILGFLKEDYVNEDGKNALSNKHGFKLKKLRFLDELNNKDIDGVEEVNSRFKDRILDFQIDIVEINQSQNPNFSPIDLFLRLNSKPFPIEPNTFEMWNSYINKGYIEIIKSCANSYAGKLFKEVDPRMKNEELITMLAYLAYLDRKHLMKPENVLNIFVRNNRINARINTKSNITNELIEISKNNDELFESALKDVQLFINKLEILCGKEFDKFNDLISHFKKNTYSKTNRNFYLLWIILSRISDSRVLEEKDVIFTKISDLFKVSQDITDEDFDIKGYIKNLTNI